MLTFRDITLEDRPWICRALRQSDFPGCEYSFANNLAWCRAASSRIAQAGGFYLICAFDTPDGAPHFSFPAGAGDYVSVFRELAAFAASMGQPLVITGVTTEMRPVLEQLFPEAFSWENDWTARIICMTQQRLQRFPEKNITKSATTLPSSRSMHRSFPR